MNRERLLGVCTLVFVIAIYGMGAWVHERRGIHIPPTSSLHESTNAVYYWRTTFQLSQAESNFLQKHHVGRMYLRMFDVVESPEQPVPNASIQFDQAVPKDMDIVPTVFITVDALRGLDTPAIAKLAGKMSERVSRMCAWNGIDNWHEVQLDCDWTRQTRDQFFLLCKEMRKRLPEDKLLSSTIRLHQLRDKVPPVDCGVLMVYNTDNFRDPHVTNSILNDSTVKEYLKQPTSFHLPLDIALPIYQWSRVFDQDGLFQEIIKNLDWKEGLNYVKRECVPFPTLIRTKALLGKYMNLKPGQYSIILYHLDEDNIKNYNDAEIKSLYYNN